MWYNNTLLQHVGDSLTDLQGALSFYQSSISLCIILIFKGDDAIADFYYLKSRPTLWPLASSEQLCAMSYSDSEVNINIASSAQWIGA